MRLILTAISLLVPINLAAEDAVSASELLQQQLEALSGFSASFEQTTLEQDGFLLDEQSGKLYFARPSQLRWEAEAPFVQTLVADGVDIYLYDPDLNQVTIRPWSSDPAENPAAIFLGSDSLTRHFSVAMNESLFILTPISETSSVIELTLSFEGNSPQTLDIQDSLGQTTKIKFSDQQINPSLAPEMFRFTIPEGAEIVTDG